MSEEKPALTLDDLNPGQCLILPTYLRELIEGLRALPNVSDMAVIKAITEFDRIALNFEESMRRRKAVFDAAYEIAAKHVADGSAPENLLSIMKATGGVPPAILQEVIDAITGTDATAEMVHPTCDCPRCQAKRAKLTSEGGSATLQ